MKTAQNSNLVAKMKKWTGMNVLMHRQDIFLLSNRKKLYFDDIPTLGSILIIVSNSFCILTQFANYGSSDINSVFCQLWLCVLHILGSADVVRITIRLTGACVVPTLLFEIIVNHAKGDVTGQAGLSVLNGRKTSIS